MNFADIKNRFDRGTYTPGMVEKLMRKGHIDQAEFQSITGQTTESVSEAREVSKAIRLVHHQLERQAVQTLDFAPADMTVLAKAGLFPDWKPGEEYKVGQRFVYGGIVYQVRQPHTTQPGWIPGTTGGASLYVAISVEGEAEADGSRGNPFAYVDNMDVERDKYYRYADKIWRAVSPQIASQWPPSESLPALWEMAA